MQEQSRLVAGKLYHLLLMIKRENAQYLHITHIQFTHKWICLGSTKGQPLFTKEVKASKSLSHISAKYGTDVI